MVSKTNIKSLTPDAGFRILFFSRPNVERENPMAAPPECQPDPSEYRIRPDSQGTAHMVPVPETNTCPKKSRYDKKHNYCTLLTFGRAP